MGRAGMGETRALFFKFINKSSPIISFNSVAW